MDGQFWREFMQGFGNAYLSDNAFGLGRQSNSNSGFSAGQRVGDAAALTQGGLETVIGGIAIITGSGGAVALAPTGVGTAVGIGVSIEGIALASHGTAVSLFAAKNLANNQSADSLGQTESKPASTVPDKAHSVLKQIEKNDFKSAPQGYKGGGIWKNDPVNGKTLLPKKARGYYQEWDVNPRISGVGRGTERIITGQEGEAFYTPDHYETLIKMR